MKLILASILLWFALHIDETSGQSCEQFDSIIFIGKDEKPENIEKLLQDLILCLRDGLDINGAHFKGKIFFYHVLTLTAGSGFNEIVTTLLEIDADVNLQDNDGFTAVMFASSYGYEDLKIEARKVERK